MNTATNSATRSGRTLGTRIHFWLAKAYRGAGRPASKEVLDEQYRSGGWRRLDTPQQMMPCMIVAGYVHQSWAEPRVLDVGCGHGRLARLLSRFPLKSYLGIDLSSEAIEQASAVGIEKAEFITGDFDQWVPKGAFDTVVFLDSLYYAEDPVSTLRRYSNVLAPGGSFVVSMYRYSNNALIQRNIARHFVKVDETAVLNGRDRWDIHVFRPRG